jgi:hypothetical protein
MRISRVVSLVAATLLLGVVVPTSATASTTVQLSGSLNGQWQVDKSSAVDAGQRYQLFRARGTTTIGSIVASGSSGSLGNVRLGNCQISLLAVTQSPKGSLSLAITSIAQYDGGAPCKVYNFRWHIAKATGAYAGETGHGTGSVVLRNPASAGVNGTFAIRFH